MDQTPDNTAPSDAPPFSLPAALEYLNSVPKIYTNSFSLGLTSSDLFLVLMVNGQPTHQLNMSLVTARSIINALEQALNDFEKKTGINIPDVRAVQELLSKP